MATLQEIEAEIARRQGVPDRLQAIEAEITRRQGVQDDLVRGVSDLPDDTPIQSDVAEQQGFGQRFMEEVVEPAAIITAGGLAEIPAGLAGIGGMIGARSPEEAPEAGARAVEATREALAIQPSTEGAQRGLQRFGEALAPVGEALQAAEKTLGRAGFEAAGPIGGAIGETLPTAALTALGVKGVKGAGRVGRIPGVEIEGTLKNALAKGTVLTTDVIPPKTFVGKAFQKITERVPILGTGKIRAIQQKARVDVLDDIAREFDVDPSAAFDKEIVSSANRIFKKSQARAATLRNEAVIELNKLDDIAPSNAIKAVDDQLASIEALGARGDTVLMQTLQNIKGELAGNFERLKDIRTTIFQDISDIGNARSPIKSGGDAVLTQIASALSKDMDDFAVNAAKRAGANKELAKAANKWKASNRIFKDNFAKAKDTELKKVLTKGKATPEVVNTVVKGGKTSELKRLHGNIDLKGREAVRQQILKNALEKANGNPTIFLNELNRLNNRKAIDIFFKGKDKAELQGYKKYLDITRRAQEEAASIATQQEVTAAGLIGGAALAPKPVIGAAATIGVLGRAFESAPVRNLLLKLSKLPPTSKKAKDIANRLAPLIAASIQAPKKEITQEQQQ